MLHTSPRREEVQCESTTGTQLNWTDLYEAKLRGANLRGANLGHAWLRGANLRRARHVTDEQLEKAETLAGATMPDGQTLKGGLLGDEAPNGPTFEEWLKDKKAQGKDEKNK
jgi:uncharacterized protein YjbI with pentapeptide repeats